MYSYIKSEPHLWTVGFYDPKDNWHTDSDHDSPHSAGERVAYLNGQSQSRKLPPHLEKIFQDYLKENNL